MKKFLTLTVASLLLASCATVTGRYELTFDTSDEAKQTELTLAAMRVVERRLARLAEEARDLDIERRDAKVILKIELADKRVADALTEQLTAPFTIGFYEEAPADGAEITVEGHGGFRSTGIGKEHILWLEAAEEPGMTGKGRIALSFTPEGFELMRGVFERNRGKFLGLFVRGQLAAKLKVDAEILKTVIVISELPSLEIAHVFADDVNVGLHVTFTKQK